MPAYAGMTTCKGGFGTRPYQKQNVIWLKANRYYPHKTCSVDEKALGRYVRLLQDPSKDFS